MNAALSETEPEGSETRGVWWRYLLAFAAVPLLIYLAGFAIVRLPGFERWGGSLCGPILDFGFQVSDANADVVLFGDSSALYNVRPLQMSHTLGVKVINLPNTVGSLPVTADMALRHYLSVNKAPRLIVFYFAAWNLDYSSHDDSHLIYEGEEMLARHGSVSQIFSFVRTHPSSLPLFPLEMYSVTPKAGAMSALRRQDRVAAIAATMGHMDAASRGGHLDSSCAIPSRLIDRTSSASVQALVSRYRTPQTTILVYIAPVPACRNAGLVTNRSYAALSAAPPKQMSPSDFWGDTFYTHLDPAAVTDATDALAGTVRPYLREPVGSAQR